MTQVSIPFNDLVPIHQQLAGELSAALDRVMKRGWFVLGPELEILEAAFARFQGGGHVVGVASGTDAIELALRAAGIGPGDEVITVAHTAVATVCAIERAGARPVLVDLDQNTFTMAPQAAAAAITPRTRAIVPVHLYGHPADLEPLGNLCTRHGLALIEDCSQAHGARYRGRRVGTLGTLAAFSFYPTKNLGACGDGGAVWTADPHLADRLRKLRNYGQVDRYNHVERGVNSRLDEIQAALLRVKLDHLEAHTIARRQIALNYEQWLTGVTLPVARPDVEHVYHLYVVRSPERDALRQRLAAQGVQTLIHYPVPVHLQPAYADLGYKPGSLPVTERICQEIVSLPLFVGMTGEQVRAVADAVVQATSGRAAA
jgi:dTDP-4-amino-4,6-dideoxygalactose transaminase